MHKIQTVVTKGDLQLTQSYVNHDTPATGPERSEGWEDGRTRCRRLVNHIIEQTLHNSDYWDCRGTRWQRSTAHVPNSELMIQINATTSLNHRDLNTSKPELQFLEWQTSKGWKSTSAWLSTMTTALSEQHIAMVMDGLHTASWAKCNAGQSLPDTWQWVPEPTNQLSNFRL